MSAELLIRFWWVRTTPRGAEVEPEVYWSTAIVSASTRARSQARDGSAGTSPDDTRGSRESAGAAVNREGSSLPMAAVVSTAEGAASLAIATRPGSERSIRCGSGGHAGTAIAPAYKQPKKEAT